MFWSGVLNVSEREREREPDVSALLQLRCGTFVTFCGTFVMPFGT